MKETRETLFSNVDDYCFKSLMWTQNHIFETWSNYLAKCIFVIIICDFFSIFDREIEELNTKVKDLATSTPSSPPAEETSVQDEKENKLKEVQFSMFPWCFL